MMASPVADWVAYHARTRPDDVALRLLETGETRSWKDLEARVARLAHAFRHRLGLAPGARVALLSDGDIRVVEVQFACIRAGLVFVPLNFRLTTGELIGVCRQVETAIIVGDRVWQEASEEIAAALGQRAPLFWGADGDEYEALIQSSDPMPARTDMAATDIVHILFTSGSTAAPKAATGTLGALVWQAFNQAEASRVAEQGAHVLTPLPLFHAGGLNSLTNPILFFGGCVTIGARFDPEAVGRYLGDPAHGVTHIALVPLMYSLIAASPSFPSGDFSSLKVAILAGGRLTGDLQSTWAAKNVAFSPQYGGTETGPSVTALAPARQDKARAGSCGTAVMHVEVKLAGEDGEDVPVGTPGEIWIRGPAITRGYLGRERTLDYSGDWFRTGDVARIDDEGFYYIVDRKKDMYKSGGENVSPAEVEEVLCDHPDVVEVAVIGVAHEKWGETGLAVLVARDGSAPGLDELRAHCEGRLARYKQPHRLEIVDQLPRNVTGKVSKEELRARFGGTVTA